MKDWMNQLFAAIDRKDTDGFISFFTKDAYFRFANAPVVCNKENIREAVGIFFSNIKSLRHRILAVWEQETVVICEGEVKYTLHNGRELEVPFVDIFRMRDDLIEDYRIYVDISALSNSNA